ncbi:hypothetical protein [uncultured Mycolicibacterium sp.]|uniref:hypothetical protein n=1 Tax=uncultured Mycolicibacterium sp. TaxID=2320817 RepID=UPI00262E0D0F|nr:hypothetical protein [uncultured Mycolicibacterium sp.]
MSRRDVALDTYRYLRGGMAVMVVLLAAGVLGERLRTGCWLDSISAYYHSAAQGPFVVAVGALGALLIVYRGGSDLEDELLDLAGVLAFVVALVPVPPPGNGCPTTAPAIPTIGVGVWALVAALAVSRLAAWWLYLRSHTAVPLSLPARMVRWGQWWLLLAGLAAFVGFRDRFDAYAHNVAAVLLFAVMVLTVGSTAWLVRRQHPDRCPNRHVYARIYRAISILMAVTVVAAVTVHLLGAAARLVLAVEAVLIGLFAVYWLVQTVELWRVCDRAELLAPAAQPNRPEM